MTIVIVDSRPSRYGFTLIELLVVIAITAILAAILFSVLAHSREKARQGVCMSNQRQLNAAILLYTQDHDETFPSADDIWQSVDLGRKVLTCPSHRSRTGIGYLYSSWIADTPLGMIADPVSTFVTADGDHPAGSPPETRMNVAYAAGDFTLCHGGKLIASYADGHLELRGVPEFPRLRLLYHFDAGNGSAVTDASGHNYHGVIRDGSGAIADPMHWGTAAEARTGASCYKNDGSAHWVMAPTAGLDNLRTGAISFDLWLNVHGSVGNENTILSFDDGDINSDSLTIYEWYDPPSSQSVLGAFYHQDPWGVAALDLETGRWYHVEVSWDNYDYRITIDGTTVRTEPQRIENPLGVRNRLRLGFGAFGNENRPFRGRLDELAIYEGMP